MELVEQGVFWVLGVETADQYAPLRSIPGIEWQPVSVEIEHVPAREK